LYECYKGRSSSINEQRPSLFSSFRARATKNVPRLGNGSSSLLVPYFLTIRHTTAASSLAGRDVSGVNEVRSNMYAVSLPLPTVSASVVGSSKHVTVSCFLQAFDWTRRRLRIHVWTVAKCRACVVMMTGQYELRLSHKSSGLRPSLVQRFVSSQCYNLRYHLLQAGTTAEESSSFSSLHCLCSQVLNDRSHLVTTAGHPSLILASP
jgi:hypothetical protein